MKKLLYLLTFAVMAITAVTGCKKSQSEGEGEAVGTDDPWMVDNGVGPIVLKARISNIPDRMKDIYDSVARITDHDTLGAVTTNRVLFYKDGKNVAVASAYKDDPIEFVSIVGPGLPLKIDGEEYMVGMPFKKIEKAPGVERDPETDALRYGKVVITCDSAKRIGSFDVFVYD